MVAMEVAVELEVAVAVAVMMAMIARHQHVRRMGCKWPPLYSSNSLLCKHVCDYDDCVLYCFRNDDDDSDVV